MMLNLQGLTSGVDSVSHGGFVQQTGPGAYTGPFTQADFDAFDAYVAAEVSALRALGYSASAQTHHPSVIGGQGPSDPDFPSAKEGAYYEWIITVDPAKFPGYVREETVAQYKSYAAGDPVRAAQGSVNDATSQKQWQNYYATQANTPPSVPSTPAVSQPRKTTSSVIDSIVDTVARMEVSPVGLSAIPTWAWLAGGAAALYFFMGRGK